MSRRVTYIGKAKCTNHDRDEQQDIQPQPAAQGEPGAFTCSPLMA